MNNLIFKSLVTFVVCLLAYTCLVNLITIDNYKAVNQLDGNKIAQENFYFGDIESKTHYIVGSSLSFRLKEENFPDSYCNLAIAGSSSPTGLRLIKERGVIPELLIVETNIIGRARTTRKVDPKSKPKPLFSMEERIIKSTFEVTQKKYQPISFFLNYALQILRPNGENQEVYISEKSRELMVEKNREEYDQEIDVESMSYRVDLFSKKVRYFQNEGTCIILMEMPISCEVQNSVKAKGMRQLMKKYLPEDEFLYLSQLDCSAITTTDGTHLNKVGAKMMVNHIINELENKKCQ